jgi:hypothetical protein
VKAIRRESASAVCHWWGITPQTVTAWRQALGIAPGTDDTTRLRGLLAREVLGAPEVRLRAIAGANTPEANAKKAASRRGKPMHPKARAALARARRRPRSPEHRRKISETMRRLGIRPPVGRPWDPWETALLGTVGDEEVRLGTGRTLKAIRTMRARLRIPAFTTTGRRKGTAMHSSAAVRAQGSCRARAGSNIQRLMFRPDARKTSLRIR